MLSIQSFLDLLFPPREDEKTVRTLSQSELLFNLNPHTVPTTRPGTIVLLPFSEPSVRSVIHEAKYHGNTKAFELLAAALSTYIKNAGYASATYIPIPLGKKRQKDRGFNQVEEVLRRAGIKTDTTILTRKRETISQISLPRHEREENMRDAFGVAHPPNPSDIYIVIDDVVTTGATLQAAINTLKATGARHIVPLALAH